MRVTSDGVSLEMGISGVGDPLMLVHGFPLSRALWGPVASLLESEAQLLLPDLAGFGASEPRPHMTIEAYARDLNFLLDEAGVEEKVVLGGLSMGGYVLFEFARLFPDRLRALILVDTRAGADSPEAREGRTRSAERVEAEGSRWLAEDLVPKLFAPQSPEALKATWRRLMAAAPPVGVSAALRAMAERADARPWLEEIACPTLVVVGEEDALTPLPDAEAMHWALPDSRLVVVPGAGHMTPVEQPAVLAAVVREFLTTLR